MLASERTIQRPFISAHSNSVGVTCHARTGRCHGTPRFSETRHWNCRRLRRAGDKRQGRAAGAAIDCRRSTAGRARNTGTASRGDQRGRSEPPAARTSTLGSSLAPPLASPLAQASLGLAPPALAPPLASPSLVNGVLPGRHHVCVTAKPPRRGKLRGKESVHENAYCISVCHLSRPCGDFRLEGDAAGSARSGRIIRCYPRRRRLRSRLAPRSLWRLPPDV